MFNHFQAWNYRTLFGAFSLAVLFFSGTEADAATFTETLQRGSSGVEVRYLQEFLQLAEEKYFEAEVTGYFGDGTKAAVQRFQKEHGLEAAGIVGPKTRQLLNSMLSGSSTSLPPPPVVVAATTESVSSIVSALQRIAELEKQAKSMWDSIGMMGRIGSLKDVTLISPTISGVSGLTDADIPDTITITGSPSFTSITTSASSTLGNGINLTGGCFSVGGTCISGGGGITGTVNSGTLNQLAYYASSGTTLSGIATSSLGIFLSDTVGTLAVTKGGTGAATFGQGWLFSSGGTGVLSASTSPTVNYIIATSTTATSTFANGINVTGGCLSVSGTCITAGAGAQTSAANTWTALQQFASGASTTLFSSYGPTYFGATATSSFSTAGVLSLVTPLTVANGGTGATTLTGLLQGSGTGAITGISGTTGQFSYFNGTDTLLATSTLFVSTGSKVGISSTTPNYLLSLGSFPVAGTQLGTTTVARNGFTQPITFAATTTVNGSKTFNWVQEAGGPTFTTKPTVLTTVEYNNDAVTLLQCNPHSITTTGMTIECVSIEDGVTAIVLADSTNRTLHYMLIGY